MSLCPRISVTTEFNDTRRSLAVAAHIANTFIPVAFKDASADVIVILPGLPTPIPRNGLTDPSTPPTDVDYYYFEEDYGIVVDLCCYCFIKYNLN